jgi:hypothetical protein
MSTIETVQRPERIRRLQLNAEHRPGRYDNEKDGVMDGIVIDTIFVQDSAQRPAR